MTGSFGVARCQERSDTRRQRRREILRHVRPSSLEKIFHTKETAWRTYGLDITVLEKNMRPASKVPNASWKACDARNHFKGALVHRNRLPSTLNSRRGVRSLILRTGRTDVSHIFSPTIQTSVMLWLDCVRLQYGINTRAVVACWDVLFVMHGCPVCASHDTVAPTG